MRYVLFILALGLLVALHELGHLLGAKLLGVRVRRFALGFGPPLFAVERRGIRFTFGAVPLGGSVDIQGMNPHEDGPEAHAPEGLSSRPPWQRLVVLLCGPLLNYLVAILVLTGLYLSGTHVPVPMTVGTVVPGSEAARVGLRPGDRVSRVDGAPVEEWSTLVERVAASAERPLVLTVLRYGAPVDVRLQPQADEEGTGRIGVSQQYVFRRHRLGEAVTLAFAHAHRVVGVGASQLWHLVRGGPEAGLSTPVGALRQASSAAESGRDAFFRVCVSLSLALAILHLLPLPALDGGRIFFALLAWATGRRVSPRVETLVHAGGFVLLVAVMLGLASAELRRMLAPHAPAAASGVAPLARMPLSPLTPEAAATSPSWPADAGVEEPGVPFAPQVSDLPP